jgi:hypothetical protein
MTKATRRKTADGQHDQNKTETQGDKAPTDYVSRIVGYGEESADQLLANPFNWRIHTQVQQQAADAVLDEIGIIQNIIVNQTTGHVVDGHMRILLAMRRRDDHPLPVTYVRLSEDEEYRALATFDAIGALAGRDDQKVKELIAAQSQEPDALRFLFAANLNAEAIRAKIRQQRLDAGASGDFSKDSEIVIVETTDHNDAVALMERLVDEGRTARVVSARANR